MFKLLIVLFLLWPVLHVIASPRSHGGAKLGWVLLTAFLSWLAYPFFLIMTQRQLDQSGRH